MRTRAGIKQFLLHRDNHIRKSIKKPAFSDSKDAEFSPNMRDEEAFEIRMRWIAAGRLGGIGKQDGTRDHRARFLFDRRFCTVLSDRVQGPSFCKKYVKI